MRTRRPDYRLDGALAWGGDSDVTAIGDTGRDDILPGSDFLFG